MPYNNDYGGGPPLVTEYNQCIKSYSSVDDIFQLRKTVEKKKIAWIGSITKENNPIIL